MSFNNPVLIARSKSAFIKEETVPGVPALPASSDYMILTEMPTFDQQQDTSTVQSIRLSRTSAETIFNNYQYGSFSNLSISARPSGIEGVPPTISEKTLLKCALGKATDPLSPNVQSIPVTSITQDSRAVVTFAQPHGFKAGDFITISNCGEAAYSGNHSVHSVTHTTLILDTDTTSTPAAASDGDISLAITRFELAEELPYFTLWFLTTTGSTTTGGGVLECLTGCQISSFEVSISKDGELKYTFSGEFQRRFTAGTAELQSSVSSGGSTLSFDPERYKVSNLFFKGEQLQIVDPSQTTELDAPITVLNIDPQSNTLTVDPLSISGDTFPSGAIVKPYLPIGTTSGSVLAQRNAQIFFGKPDLSYGNAEQQLFHSDQKLLGKSGNLNLSQNLQKPLEKELTGDAYGNAAFIPENREITGDVEVVFRINDQSRYQDLTDAPRHSLGYRVGRNKGQIVDFYFPRVFVKAPTDSQEEGARIQTLSWNTIEPAVGVEEEFKIYYR